MKLSSIDIILFLFLFSLSKSIIEFKDSDERPQEFRAVWSSPWGGDEDLITYTSAQDFKKNMLYILDILKTYNMNSIIYHVRTHNDALYQSELNPVSHYFEKVNYAEFEPLKWLIDETHKRGIEFHAWMNPYRITSNASVDINTILQRYASYPKNPASVKENILYAKDAIFMNPALENVRTFIVDTIIEFLDKYDVEAIHFDDYFYYDMGAGGETEGSYTILNETDQQTYEEYIKTHPDCRYKADNAKDKADWRREQVDLLIIKIKQSINEYNKKNKKYIQFGISPTGVYKNGDGVVTYDENLNAITTGSDTSAGQEHYASYLFCDTVKWCNEGWIDYLLPQSYWATDHPLCKYKNIMDWWDKVLKYKKVNLYSGLGLFFSDEKYNTYNWQKDEFELYNELKFVASRETIDGASIYNFHTLRTLKDGKDEISAKQVKNGIKAWTKRVPPSEIKAFEKIKLQAPKNIEFKKSTSTLSFDKVEGAKFYIIYKSNNEVKFIEDEIKDIIGNPQNSPRIEWKESNNGNFKYGLRVISYSNTLGDTTTEINYINDVNSSKMNIISLMTLCCLLILLF